jgi:hypothetical protein
MRFFVEYRFVLSLALSAITGVIGRHRWPFPEQNMYLALIQARQPTIYGRFSYTDRFVASLALSPLMGMVGLHVWPAVAKLTAPSSSEDFRRTTPGAALSGCHARCHAKSEGVRWSVTGWDGSPNPQFPEQIREYKRARQDSNLRPSA